MYYFKAFVEAANQPYDLCSDNRQPYASVITSAELKPFHQKQEPCLAL